MSNTTVVVSAVIGGVPITATALRTTSGQTGVQPTIPGAFTGTLSTRTNDHDGVVTLDSGHGIESGDRFDVYWEGGVLKTCTASSVSGNDVTFTAGGGGDALPVVDSEIRASKFYRIDMIFDAALIGTMLMQLGQDGRVAFFSDYGESSESSLGDIDLKADEPYLYIAEGVGTNPIGGYVVEVVIVTHTSTQDTDFKLGVGFYSDSDFRDLDTGGGPSLPPG